MSEEFGSETVLHRLLVEDASVESEAGLRQRLASMSSEELGDWLFLAAGARCDYHPYVVEDGYRCCEGVIAYQHRSPHDPAFDGLVLHGDQERAYISFEFDFDDVRNECVLPILVCERSVDVFRECGCLPVNEPPGCSDFIFVDEDDAHEKLLGFAERVFDYECSSVRGEKKGMYSKMGEVFASDDVEFAQDEQKGFGE